jgi:beta-lactamase superfamily II metal-dependent hydrolase
MEDIYAAYQVAHTMHGDTGTSLQFKQFMDAASTEPDSIVKEDEDEVIGLPNGANLTILDIIDGDTNTNNNSVVTALEVGGKRMLVSGDTENEESKAVRTALVGHLQDERLYPIDVYIVGHHGSETSSSAELVSLIKPTYAVISSEGPSDRYHNPDITVIERLAAVVAATFSTYRSGDIVISFEQDHIKLSPSNSERLTIANYRDEGQKDYSPQSSRPSLLGRAEESE